MVVTANVGQTLTVHVRWQNTGTGTHSFWIYGGAGTLADTGTTHTPTSFSSFVWSWYGGISHNVTAGTITEDTFSKVLGVTDVGTWDIAGAVCDATSAVITTVTVCYDFMCKHDEATVSHVLAATILDVWATVA